MSAFRPSSPDDMPGTQLCSTTDVDLVRTAIFPNGVKSVEDVMALISINEAYAATSKAWRDFFVESLTDFVVKYSYPQGSLDTHNADWVRRMFAPDGHIRTTLELSLLLRIVDTSQFVPCSLNVLLLGQVALAMATGKGAYAHERLCGQAIGQQDVAFIMRVARLANVASTHHLRPAEIAMLRKIDGLAENQDNHIAWSTLMSAVENADATKLDHDDPRWLRVSDDILLTDSDAA